MNVVVVNNEQQLKDAYSIRTKVFVMEQKVPLEIEKDQFEKTSVHFVAYDENIPIGAGRLRELDGYGKIERICVDEIYRNKGIGKMIMEEIEAEGRKRGLAPFKLNSQTHAVPFYENLGYEISSEPFLDAGIPHVTMIKR